MYSKHLLVKDVFLCIKIFHASIIDIHMFPKLGTGKKFMNWLDFIPN